MGMLNGQQHAYLYDDATGLAVDLHELYSGPGTAVPAGWRVGSATGINDDGVIVGVLGLIGNSGEVLSSLPYILDPQHANQIVLLPDDFLPAGARAVYLRINNYYDIVTMYVNADGSYGAFFYNYLLGIDTLQLIHGSLLFRGAVSPISLNNATPAQVSSRLSLTTPFLWTSGPGGGMQAFSSDLFAAACLNDDGVLCGQTTSKGKSYPTRLSSSTTDILTGAPGYSAMKINNSGDVLLHTGSVTDDTSKNLIFHNQRGYFDVDKLVDLTDPDLADWAAGSPLCWFINDRDSTGFGQITGILWSSDGTQRPFMLTPVVP